MCLKRYQNYKPVQKKHETHKNEVQKNTSKNQTEFVIEHITKTEINQTVIHNNSLSSTI